MRRSSLNHQETAPCSPLPVAAIRIGFVLSLAFLSVPLAAQDTTMAKGTMAHDAMMKKDDMMMSPHGSFTGANDHTVSGNYEIAEKDGKLWLMLQDDFSLDKAPDPYIVLSSTGKGSGQGTVNLGALKKQKGASVFEIKGVKDVKAYSQVLVWCKKYNVTLGQASLAAMMDDKMMSH